MATNRLSIRKVLGGFLVFSNVVVVGFTKSFQRNAQMKRFAALLFALAIVNCGGSDSSVGPNASVGGTWNLRSINGTPLPANFVDQGTTLTITSSTLTMSGSTSGAYNEVIAYRAVSGGQTVTGTQTEVGTWSANGGSITFNDQTDRTTYQGSVSGNTLTEIVNGFTQVYSR